MKNKSGQFFLFILFFVSGFSSLIYQVSWQRALFSVLGSNIESTTIIVSVFMSGLGIGALSGGLFTKKYSNKTLIIFSVLEVLTGIYGFFSLEIISFIADPGIHSHVITALWSMAVLIIPTLFMGATLPVLTSHINRHFCNAGTSVAALYFFNTTGAALSCIFTVIISFELLGLSGTVSLAASLNLLVGISAFTVYRRRK